MRILLVTRDFPLHVGEVPAWSYELGRRFASRCHDFALLALWRGRGRPADASEPHARVRRRVLEQLDGVFPLDGGCDTKRFTPGTSRQLARELGLSGRRVVAGDGPGRGELERLALRLHRGLSTSPDACGDLVENIARLLEARPCAQSLGDDNRAHVLAHASWDGQAERLLHAMSAGQPVLPRSERPGRAAHRSNDAVLN